MLGACTRHTWRFEDEDLRMARARETEDESVHIALHQQYNLQLSLSFFPPGARVC